MGVCCTAFRTALAAELFSYETPKMVTVHSKVIGSLNRLVQLFIVVYVIVFVFIIGHGYQYIDKAAKSATTSKIKGISYTNSSDRRVGERVWDMADLVIPPHDDGGFFLTTNVISTVNQSQGTCAEYAWNKASCRTDSDCQPIGKPYHLGNGVSTGECNKETGTCMVRAWCPLENDSMVNDGKEAVLNNIEDFTVFIKSHVHFPRFETTRSNLIESVDKKYLRSCNYHPDTEPYCPIFRVGDMVSLATDHNPNSLSDHHYKDMAVKGGVIAITIKWDCNLDRNLTECKPQYGFNRLDNFGGNDVATGYNFRYPNYYREDGQDKRTLIKAYGILFLITTEAQARKFDAVTFFQNLGSGLALLGIASVCCDIFLLNIHKKKSIFKNHVFEKVNDCHDHEDETANHQCKKNRSRTPSVHIERIKSPSVCSSLLTDVHHCDSRLSNYDTCKDANSLPRRKNENGHPLSTAFAVDVA